jgi:predicted AlkP superfamily phosphohydrolase/phosphomutase
VFETVRGVPPDLFVYFGDLRWRSIGTVGWSEIHRFENDMGPDDANHAAHGMFIVRHPDGGPVGVGEEMSYLDVAPTLLKLLGLPPQAHLKGRVVA